MANPKPNKTTFRPDRPKAGTKLVASSRSTRLNRRSLRMRRSIKIFGWRGNAVLPGISRLYEAFGQVGHAEIQITEQKSITVTYKSNGVRARKIGD